MTTDQIRTIDSHVDSSDASRLSAEQQADQIVAKARYEAFRMVTDARAEAEAILAEAKPVHQLGGEAEDDDPDGAGSLVAAVEQAAAILERARFEAEEIGASIVDRATAEAEEIVGRARNQAEDELADLLAEHRTLEHKVATSRSVLETLEARLAAIATTTPAAAPSTPTPARTPAGNRPEDPPEKRDTMTAPGRKAMWAPSPLHTEGSGTAESSDALAVERTAPVVLDYSPSVPPTPEPVETAEVEEQSDERGSYYSRRSAKLPRIGDSAGHDALGAMKYVRRAIDQ